MAKNINEDTSSGSVAGYDKPVGSVVKRVEEETTCQYCKALRNGGNRVKCGMCKK